MASYTVEDISIDLSIKFPLNYPLASLEIDCGKRVGVDVAKWRTWLLQLTAFLNQVNITFILNLLNIVK